MDAVFPWMIAGCSISVTPAASSNEQQTREVAPNCAPRVRPGIHPGTPDMSSPQGTSFIGAMFASSNSHQSPNHSMYTDNLETRFDISDTRGAPGMRIPTSNFSLSIRPDYHTSSTNPSPGPQPTQPIRPSFPGMQGRQSIQFSSVPLVRPSMMAGRPPMPAPAVRPALSIMRPPLQPALIAPSRPRPLYTVKKYIEPDEKTTSVSQPFSFKALLEAEERKRVEEKQRDQESVAAKQQHEPPDRIIPLTVMESQPETKEQKRQIFIDMLRHFQVQHDAKWNDYVIFLVKDVRYKLLKNMNEKLQCFRQYTGHLKQLEEDANIAIGRRELEALLEASKNVLISCTCVEDAQKKLGHTAGWKSLDSYSTIRREIFDAYAVKLAKEVRETKEKFLNQVLIITVGSLEDVCEKFLKSRVLSRKEPSSKRLLPTSRQLVGSSGLVREGSKESDGGWHASSRARL